MCYCKPISVNFEIGGATAMFKFYKQVTQKFGSSYYAGMKSNLMKDINNVDVIIIFIDIFGYNYRKPHPNLHNL